MIIDNRQQYQKPVVANAFNAWVDIQAPMALVFEFLSDERELARWWTSKCTAEPRPGGKLHFVWVTNDTEMTGDAIFRRFEPPNHITLEWTHRNGEEINCDGEDARGMRWPALNIYNLAQIDGNTTRLHLHDLGIASGAKYEELRKATEGGWAASLARLKKAIENRQLEEINRKMRKKKTGPQAS